jgi:hypothetical protein
MPNLILESILTCPACGRAKTEVMPVDACLYFYECTRCGAVLKPRPADFCVFRSYGTVTCPPRRVPESDCARAPYRATIPTLDRG